MGSLAVINYRRTACPFWFEPVPFDAFVGRHHGKKGRLRKGVIRLSTWLSACDKSKHWRDLIQIGHWAPFEALGSLQAFTTDWIRFSSLSRILKMGSWDRLQPFQHSPHMDGWMFGMSDFFQVCKRIDMLNDSTCVWCSSAFNTKKEHWCDSSELLTI